MEQKGGPAMTREEAIKQLESLRLHCRAMIHDEDENNIWAEDVEALDAALAALRREQAEKVWRGEWIHPHWSNDVSCADCRRCGKEAYHQLYHGVQDYYNFCPHCGALMTDEAVEMEVLKNES